MVGFFGDCLLLHWNPSRVIWSISVNAHWLSIKIWPNELKNWNKSIEMGVSTLDRIRSFFIWWNHFNHTHNWDLLEIYFCQYWLSDQIAWKKTARSSVAIRGSFVLGDDWTSRADVVQNCLRSILEISLFLLWLKSHLTHSSFICDWVTFCLTQLLTNLIFFCFISQRSISLSVAYSMAASE